MIRHKTGNEFLLFAQDDHARFSAQLAEQLGNSWFNPPEPRKAVIDAIALHDAGWPLHDNEPTLNDAGQPLHVFETPIPIAARIWSESVRVALRTDTYTGFLVSLHVFALSALSYQHYADPQDRRKNAKELFELNKFQQSQIEIQEKIRRQMRLLTDVPLTLGLAPRGSGIEEDRLRFNYCLLKAMDQVSLAVLCGGKPFTTIEEVAPRSQSDPLDLRVMYPAPWTVAISPWPFRVDQIEMQMPYRRVLTKPFASVEEFRKSYGQAAQEFQIVRVLRAG